MIHPDELPEAVREKLFEKVTPEMQAKQDAAKTRARERVSQLEHEAQAGHMMIWADGESPCNCGAPENHVPELTRVEFIPKINDASDALLARLEEARVLVGLFRAWNVSPEQIEALQRILASAERIAAAVTQQGENR